MFIEIKDICININNITYFYKDEISKSLVICFNNSTKMINSLDVPIGNLVIPYEDLLELKTDYSKLLFEVKIN